jgi:hypothetical protein
MDEDQNGQVSSIEMGVWRGFVALGIRPIINPIIYKATVTLAADLSAPPLTFDEYVTKMTPLVGDQVVLYVLSPAQQTTVRHLFYAISDEGKTDRIGIPHIHAYRAVLKGSKPVINGEIFDSFCAIKKLALEWEKHKLYTVDQIMDRMVAVIGHLDGSVEAKDAALISPDEPSPARPIVYTTKSWAYRDDDARSGKALSSVQVRIVLISVSSTPHFGCSCSFVTMNVCGNRS